MEEVLPLITAGVAGFAAGFMLSIPVGPINVTILDEASKRGFFNAAMVSLGAMLMDIIYCGIAFAGFSGLFTTRVMRATMELLSFLLLIYLGLKYMLAHSISKTSRTMERVEEKLHPHTAFWIGFVRVLGNPAVLLLWVTVSASFLAHGWITDDLNNKLMCVVGTFFGGLSWFILLSFLVSRGHGKFSTNTLVKMSHISGASLLVAAVFIGFRLIRILADRPPGS
jgi:threonine/homoserine/homoserine lactone efflux protein